MRGVAVTANGFLYPQRKSSPYATGFVCPLRAASDRFPTNSVSKHVPDFFDERYVCISGGAQVFAQGMP